jgi:DNA-binding NtrC family response regulator
VEIRVKVARTAIKKETPASVDGDLSLVPLAEHRQTAERQYLQDLMSQTRGHIRDACRVSGLSRSRLYALLKEHNISTGP